MRCPKCQYISFGSGNRCRNCGYDFSLADEAAPFEDLPIQTGDEPIGPLRDLPLGAGAPGRAPGPSSVPPPAPTSAAAPATGAGRDGAPGSTADLPLFSFATADDRPLVAVPAVPRPPLAVRRDPPVITRLRRSPIDDEPGDADFDPAGPPRARSRAHTPAFADEDAREGPAGSSGGPAPVPARLLAGTLDVAIMGAIDLAVIFLTLRFTGLTVADLALLPLVPMAAFLLLLNGGYLVMFTAAGGQTIGKMAAAVRVVPDNGRVRVPFATAIVRAAAYLMALLPAGLGLLPILFSPDGRAIHDRLSSTRVVKA